MEMMPELEYCLLSGVTNGILRFDDNLPGGPSQFYLNAGLTNTSGFTGNLTGNAKYSRQSKPFTYSWKSNI